MSGGESRQVPRQEPPGSRSRCRRSEVGGRVGGHALTGVDRGRFPGKNILVVAHGDTVAQFVAVTCKVNKELIYQVCLALIYLCMRP